MDNINTGNNGRNIFEAPFMRNTRQWQEDNLRLRGPGKFSSYDLHRTRTGVHMRNATERFIDRVNVDFLPGATAPSRKRYRGRRSANLEKFAEAGNRFINEVAYQLGIVDRVAALRITKAVLHAVRDRLMPDDAVEFAQGLPMLIKGLYFDQYNISHTPVIIRNAEEFINFVREKDRFGAVEDFRSPMDVVISIQAVFRVLENNMDYGQVEQIKHELPKEIVQLIDNFVSEDYHADVEL